jgi:tetratricopeptide (TPR) repeat protein
MRRILPVLLVCLMTGLGARPAAVSTADAEIQRAYQHAYNLDYEDALAAAMHAVALGPNESRAHRALAAMIWLDLLFRRGAVTVDHYLGGIAKANVSLPKPPADRDKAFKQAIERALALAEARRKRAPDDLEALHDIGAAHALMASYTASIEGGIRSAFGAARRAFDAETDVLERDPSFMPAAAIVGTYRYLVSSLNLPTRVFAYVMGMGGDRERAIALLTRASRDERSQVEAMTSLVLIHSREGRHREAQRLLATLAAAYPRNRLFVLEQGSAALRAGRASEAHALLEAGLRSLESDRRPPFHGERALWLYKRGLARLALDRRGEAAADFAAALANSPPDWTRARLHLAQGKLADLAGQRSQAQSLYRLAQQLGNAAKDPACVNEARRLLEKPYRG